MRRRGWAGLAGVILASPGAAQAAEQDEQVWTSVAASTALGPQVDATLELHGRFTDGASRLGQTLVRPSLTYKLGGGWSATAGYVHVRNRPQGAVANTEHRTWQQVGYALYDPEGDGLLVTGRTRLEQRFRENADGTGWRLRQQFRLSVPIAPAGKLRALASNETFVGLNDTPWGQRSRVDQVRTFIGASLPLAEKLTFEPGYLNQIVIRTGPDRVNHIAALNLQVRL